MADTKPPVNVAQPRPNFTPSGTVATPTAASTPSGVFTGPWFVEEQTMTVQYQRVPFGSLSSISLSLSGVDSTHRIAYTKLACEAQATYNSYKDLNDYSTSTWTQPQKFEFLQFSADARGHAYGTLNASCLGPMGSIVTVQPYYHRVPWSDTNSAHTIVSKSMEGANYYAAAQSNSYANGQWYNTSTTLDPRPYVDDYERWLIEPHRAGSFNADEDVTVKLLFGLSYIPGTYAINKESLWNIYSMLDNFGNAVKSLAWAAMPATMGNDMRDQGFLEYEISRHDYS